nr:orotidine 5'-phosphate decarboxylase / HUMPS family protein [Pyrolobus fumarii]
MVAFDPPRSADVDEWLQARVNVLRGRVAGFKVGWPLLLRAGIDRVYNIFSRLEGLRVLDLKLADIGHVMRLVLEDIVDAFDAVIAHAFVGVEGALDELSEFLSERGARLILVYSMSHPGARATLDTCRDVVDKVVQRVKPWGLVVPATRPEVIREARGRYPDIVLVSPGVGAQGAEPGSAICAGADYEIIGRAIAWADDPVLSLRTLAERGVEKLRECIMGKR